MPHVRCLNVLYGSTVDHSDLQLDVGWYGAANEATISASLPLSEEIFVKPSLKV